MRKVLQSTPLSNIEKARKTKYVLTFLQQPKFARESTKLKRLLHPHSVVTLNVYVEAADGSYMDVTSHNLSTFFLKASVVETTPEEEQDRYQNIPEEKVLVGNKVMSGALYNLPGDYDFKIINSEYHHRYRQQQFFMQQQFQQPSVYPPPYPPTTIVQPIYGQPLQPIANNGPIPRYANTLHPEAKAGSDKSSFKDNSVYSSVDELAKDVNISINNDNNGVVVFIFNDLGVVKRGNFKLRFELFKFECFQYAVKDGNSIPNVMKVGDLYSGEFKVYGSRQFYKKDNQEMFSKELDLEKDRLQSDKTLAYLKKIKVLRDISEERGNASAATSTDEKRKDIEAEPEDADAGQSPPLEYQSASPPFYISAPLPPPPPPPFLPPRNEGTFLTFDSASAGTAEAASSGGPSAHPGQDSRYVGYNPVTKRREVVRNFSRHTNFNGQYYKGGLLVQRGIVQACKGVDSKKLKDDEDDKLKMKSDSDLESEEDIEEVAKDSEANFTSAGLSGENGLDNKRKTDANDDRMSIKRLLLA